MSGSRHENRAGGLLSMGGYIFFLTSATFEYVMYTTPWRYVHLRELGYRVIFSLTSFPGERFLGKI